ncbi:hypothetical protein CYMTET_56639 [Cymbomonas tetramitiformis]|uniref:Pyrimidine 5-nucleotidase n=1 Tax=Cymbomonas tetramitiformis TaxID=36881 RepID=A0AAE0BBZ4_9CHLO|nr:hypothetical protein CYMTET_56639 [Cymbomonas tetramitiformis]|eukprot:gene14893-17606_t
MANIDTLIFDLDGTLYPNDNGYVDHIRGNAERFIHETLGVPAEEAGPTRKKALALANQTALGLRMQGFDFVTEDLVSCMREGAELFMTPDKEVQDFLSTLCQKKKMYIFTNTREVHAREALELLGLSSYFLEVYGADFMGDCCKPQEAAFQKVLDDISVDAKSCVMFEDSLKNLRTAKFMGMTTVFITSEDDEQGVSEEGGTRDPDLSQVADAIVTTCTSSALLPQLPLLWNA